MSQTHPTFPSFSIDDARALTHVELLTYGDHPDQRIELYGTAANSNSVIVLLHGGYWRSLFDCEHIRPLAVALAQSGFYVAIPEFQRVAGNPSLTLNDLRTALSKINNCEMTIIGYSSGGHLALILADEFAAVKRVIALAPVTDLVESQRRELGRGAVLEWLGGDASKHVDLDPMKRPAIKAELIIIQGSEDERVPIDISYSYREAKQAEGATIEMVTLDGTTHFEMMAIPSPTYSAITAVLVR
jgi:pimeloyl-ACP methyl ester carboxylesterase